MGTTLNKLNYLFDTKTAIKNAIKNKGVSVSDSDTFRSYANKINQIPTQSNIPCNKVLKYKGKTYGEIQSTIFCVLSISTVGNVIAYGNNIKYTSKSASSAKPHNIYFYRPDNPDYTTSVNVQTVGKGKENKILAMGQAGDNFIIISKYDSNSDIYVMKSDVNLNFTSVKPNITYSSLGYDTICYNLNKTLFIKNKTSGTIYYTTDGVNYYTTTNIPDIVYNNNFYYKVIDGSYSKIYKLTLNKGSSSSLVVSIPTSSTTYLYSFKDHVILADSSNYYKLTGNLTTYTTFTSDYIDYRPDYIQYLSSNCANYVVNIASYINAPIYHYNLFDEHNAAGYNTSEIVDSDFNKRYLATHVDSYKCDNIIAFDTCVVAIHSAFNTDTVSFLKYEYV